MKKVLIVTGIMLLFLSVGCKEKKENNVTEYMQTIMTGFTQGTVFNIIIRDEIDSLSVRQDIDSVFLVMEQSMSLYDSASLLSRLNRNETDSVDRHIAECIRISEQISRESDGLFDVTVKPLTGAYGFAGENRNETPNIDSLLQFVGYEKIRVENGRLIKDHPNVVGIKDSSKETYKDILDASKGGMNVLAGSANYFLDLMAIGGTGGV